MSATVKLCLLGGDCEAKCLRTFSHAKSYRVSFRFTPKLSDQVVIIDESNFLILVIVEINNMTQRNEKKNGDLQICRYSNSCK